MECPRCGYAGSDDATSCPSCGAPLTWRVLMPDGGSFGPYSTHAVRQYIAEGRIPPTANVVQDATGVQMALWQARVLPEGAPAAPAPPVAPVPAAQAPAERRGFFRRTWYIWLIVGGVFLALVLPMLLGAAILWPVFGKAREKARQTACLSNVKQLAMACLMYASDWDECLPPAADYQSFHDSVFPYVRNEGLFKCPSALNEQGYAFNPNLAGVSIKKLAQPANTPMLWDAGAPLPGVPPPPGTTSGRHNGGDTVAFADGHAKWLTAAGASGLSTSGPPAPSGTE